MLVAGYKICREVFGGTGMFQVIKRDGKIKDFDITKIVDAIRSAFESKQKEYCN